MLIDTLLEEMKVAMKSGDKVRLSVIRMLRAEMKNAQIESGEELPEDVQQKIVASYAKKRKGAREQALKLGRNDLAEKELLEYDITVSFLPPQLDDDELTAIVRDKIAETGAQGPKDFGVVIKVVLKEVGGRAEGSAVSAAVKKLLTG